ncbi:hypothetical protein [Streptomyces erythrochromogenes]|uniref:hypothetical protein n=1 Tax=Streptomyces erythrochromogenes TaxID=285574 RepID=UPI00367DD88E
MLAMSAGPLRHAYGSCPVRRGAPERYVADGAVGVQLRLAAVAPSGEDADQS